MVEFHHARNDLEFPITADYLTTTAASNAKYEVEEDNGHGYWFSGCSILTYAGSLLTRNPYELKVSSDLNH